MPVDLKDIRIRLDQQTERIVSGLKDRSRYLLNNGVYSECLPNRRTWFEDRVYMDLCSDALHGRFEFEDQAPFLFLKKDLPKSLVKRNVPKPCLAEVSINIGEDVIDLYRKTLFEICMLGENRSDYGAVAKLDASNVACLHERIRGLGPYVAQSKIEKDPSLLEIFNEDFLREQLVYPEREEEVMQKAVEISEKYGLPYPESMRQLFRGVIDLTLNVELAYIKEVRQNPDPVGWGRCSKPKRVSGMGFGNGE